MWFKTFESKKYSKFDETGLPTHIFDLKSETGEKELSKEIKNGLKKEINK